MRPNELPDCIHPAADAMYSTIYAKLYITKLNGSIIRLVFSITR